MSNHFDFNIDNYSTEDLVGFFKLHNNYTIEELYKKERNMTLEIIGSKSNPQYKIEIIEFIKKAQERLLEHKMDENNKILSNKIKAREYETDEYDNVGKILNPLSTSHQTLQGQKIISNTSNSYKNHLVTTNYIFNTIFRDDFFNTLPNDCSFTLPFTIKNVAGISLSGVQVPNVSSAFSDSKGTNELFIEEYATNIGAIVVLPSGNYLISDFVVALEKAINIQLLASWPNRFQVTYNTNTNRITISNTTYEFGMNIIEKNPDLLTSCLYELGKNTNADEKDSKKGIRPTDFVNTMGYLIGYRQIEYNGLKSYQAESVYNDTLQDYYYFQLNDYTGYQFSNTIGVMPTGFIGNNIIAVLPITTPKFISSFDNNANFIYKARRYAAPINLKKISIKMLGPEGELVDVKRCDFSFVLEINVLYDNIMPFERPDVALV
jgi:hypothetical protein